MMNLPLQITYRNVKPSETVAEWIREEVAKLETFSNQIMGCRVAVEVPHSHRRKGAPYHVRIDLTLPGRGIVIKREATLGSRTRRAHEMQLTKRSEVDASHSDLRVTIDDAFKAVGRRLQDVSRRQRRDVKVHEPVPVARVSKLLPKEGYGFLLSPEGREVYFHKASVLNRAFGRLKIGTIVTFVEEQGEKGPQATTVRVAGKQGARPAGEPIAV